MTATQPKYYRIELTVKAEIAEDTDAIAHYLRGCLEKVHLTVVGPEHVYEVSH